MHKLPQPILLLLPLCLIACTARNGSESAAGNAAANPERTAGTRSARYHADSLRLFGPATRLFEQRQEREAIRYCDSTFMLPACLDPDAPPHPDSLNTAEARLLCNRALRSLMTGYNRLMDFEGGRRHLDSLEHLRLPFVERYCLRALLTAKAQMMMAPEHHAEALQCLNRAMQLAHTDDSLAAKLSAADLKRAYASGLLERPENDSYWSAAAGITYMGVDSASTRAELAFERVMDIALRTGFRGGLYPHAIARLADIYLSQGKYEQSIALCRQAIATTPPDRTDEQGIYIAAENLTEAYRRLGLYDEALRYCALVTDAPSDFEVLNNLRGHSYLNKANILAETDRTAEALVALQQADSCFRRTGNDYFRLQTSLQRAHLLSLVPDSLPAALHIFASLEDSIPAHRQAFFLFYYGNACSQAGQYARAIPMLERAVTESENISERFMAHQAARLLTECYRHTGRADRLADFLPRYQALSDSIASDAKIRQLASANIRFETEKKEQENRALTAEVALKDSRLRTTLLVGTLCLLLAAGIIIWVVMRHRAIRIRQEAAATLLREQEAQLHSLIRDRQQLNDRNLDLVRQLSDIQATHESTCNLDSIMESLQQSLFSKEDAERFRQNFSAVYPTALNRLRSRCPDLTYSDELFCMLAMLQLDNSEMARTLGISKSSVSKTRYRIRIKLGLPEGADADIEIRKVMSAEE